MTTNAELIAHLQQFPLDAVVTIDMMSEAVDLDLEQVKYVPADVRELFRQNDNYITYRPYIKDDPDTLEWVAAVRFPGN